MNHLKVRSCLIDGEVVCCDERGLATFQLLRRRRNEPKASLYAFDLLELNGDDLRREPIEVRKATLASILRKSRPGVRLNEHIEHPEGVIVFQHACKMGLEGIVSKRLGSGYRSGRSPDWLKFKNPDAPAVKREAEEDTPPPSRPPHRPLHHPPGPIPTDLNDRHSRMMPAAQVLGLGSCLEPHRLNVRPGDDEVVLDAAEGEGGHRGHFRSLAPMS